MRIRHLMFASPETQTVARRPLAMGFGNIPASIACAIGSDTGTTSASPLLRASNVLPNYMTTSPCVVSWKRVMRGSPSRSILFQVRPRSEERKRRSY